VGLRVAAGVATPEEVRVLSESPRVVGNGLVVYPPLSPEQWAAKYGGDRAVGYEPPPDRGAAWRA
jgi:hypothetical protein